MQKVFLAVVVVSLFLVPAFAGRVALILDVGGRGDLSFNDMGFKGTEEAVRDFGWEMVEIQSATAADYLPNIRNAARSGAFDLIICVGFLLADALNQVAPEFPNQKFAIIDAVVDHPNVLSIVFEEQEGSALVGALAGMLAGYFGYPYVGVVLGIEIPVLYHFEGGYRFGIDWGLRKYAEVTGEKPDVGLLWVYTGTFSDIAKGKAAAEAQLEQGAVAVYNVAGPLGIGILEAVTEKLEEMGKEMGPPFMIGVDANQDWMGDGNKVIASMMKRVDVGCYTAIKMVHEGTFKGGVLSMGLANKGVAISRYQDLLDFIEFGIAAGAITEEDKPRIIENWKAMRASVPQWIWDAVDELEQKILSGEIVVPKPETREEMLKVREMYPLKRG
ncbi:MAG TPA: BMP family ABC transporter substrate-binding protein [Candidatus Acetothermia bacterium]|nr:BMP family ABC transporter substrate-binding protein [Candidatus Acetothermia bacterium]